MKKIKRNKKFKNQMIRYSLSIILLIAFMIGFHTYYNYVFTNRYNNIYSLYYNLSNFYAEETKAHDAVKSYLYTDNEEEYNAYSLALNNASYCLEDMKSKTKTYPESWRLKLLQNMLDSYSEKAEQAILLGRIQDSEYGKTYGELVEINDTIIKTSDDYFKFLTNSMDKLLAEIQGDKKTAENISLTIMFISFFLVFLYTWILQRSITDPIEKFVDNMDEIKAGTFDLKNVDVHNEEFEILSLALQDLSDNIHKNIEHEKEKNKLRNELLIKENENLKKDELLATSELKVLQNQINPHFLFNTINMIYQQAIIEDSPVTLKMIEKMTECLRYTMNQTLRTSTLRMELNFVKNYIYIQNKRFEGTINFELNYEDNLPNIIMPAMIIEPLIDNSVKHGLSNTDEDGLISINVFQENDYVKISVSDNGKGMNSEELETLVANDFKIEDDDMNIGLSNLSQRLKMYFGEEALITVNSYEDCGFETLISIPISESEVS